MTFIELGVIPGEGKVQAIVQLGGEVFLSHGTNPEIAESQKVACC